MLSAVMSLFIPIGGRLLFMSPFVHVYYCTVIPRIREQPCYPRWRGSMGILRVRDIVSMTSMNVATFLLPLCGSVQTDIGFSFTLPKYIQSATAFDTQPMLARKPVSPTTRVAGFRPTSHFKKGQTNTHWNSLFNSTANRLHFRIGKKDYIVIYAQFDTTSNWEWISLHLPFNM